MPFKRHNPGCPCCDEISSSSSSSSSSSASSSSSVSSSSSSSSEIIYNPCDPLENSTLYLKIETFGFEDEFANLYTNCQPTNLFFDRANMNGTWLFPFVRSLGPPIAFAFPTGQTIAETLHSQRVFNANGTTAFEVANNGRVFFNNSATIGQVKAESGSPPVYQSEVVYSRPTCDPSTWISNVIGFHDTAIPGTGGIVTNPDGCGTKNPQTITVTVSGILRVSIVPGPAP